MYGAYVGRTRELSELEAALDELTRGRGRLFLVTGEPGIGKTRLADEAAGAARARGISVHWGRAWEAGGAPSYWPFVQALRSIAPESDALAALVTPAHSAAERFQLFEVVDAFLRDASVPRLLILDDLHASDVPSLQLLHFIVRDLRSRPLMVIGTYRDAEARLAGETARLLGLVAREGDVLPLRRLSRDEIGKLVAAATGHAADEKRVLDLHQQTEGNPLFLHELLQLHGTRVRALETIREVVRARLALVPYDVRRTLEAAAVLGREFTIGPLAVAAGVSEIDARALLEPAARASLVEPLDDPPRWRFTHVLLRQGLYDDLATDRRAELHRTAAEQLRRRAGEPPLAELAHHLANAVPAVSAVEAADASLRAGEYAMSVLAFEDASVSYSRAEALLERVPGEARRQFEAALGIGLAQMRVAEIERGKVACRRAAAIAKELGDATLFARAVVTACYEHAPGIRDAVTIAALEEAIALLPSQDDALRARCMALLAAERQPEPDPRVSIELARAAIAIARHLDDGETLRATLSTASIVLSVHVDPQERIAVNHEALRLAQASRDVRTAIRAHLFLAGDALELGDLVAVRAHERSIEALLPALRHARFDWVLSFVRAEIAYAEGRFDDGAAHRADTDAKVRHDEARGTLLGAVPIGVACISERYEDRPAIEAQVRATFGALPHPMSALLGDMFLAQLHARAGDRRATERQLALVRGHPTFRFVEAPLWLTLLVDACCLVQDARLAERIHRALAPSAERFAFFGGLAFTLDLPYARHLGLLAATLGRADDAVSYLEKALSRSTDAGIRSHLGRLRFELARALEQRARSGDRERAATLLAEARALATELGQTGLLAQLPEMADAPPTVATTPVPAPSLVRDGDDWAMRWGGRTIHLRDARGVRLLAKLLEHPDEELHVLQLAGADDGLRDTGDAGALLDDVAVRSYRSRLLDLRDELDEAERFADEGRAAASRSEIEFVTRELARAVGLGGRDRRAADASERARTAVQKRLRETIRRVEGQLPDLGRHLDQTIRTGLFCGYLPSGRR